MRLNSPFSKVRSFDMSGVPSSRDHSCVFISVVQLRVKSSPSVILTFLTNVVGTTVVVVEVVVVGLSVTDASNITEK